MQNMKRELLCVVILLSSSHVLGDTKLLHSLNISDDLGERIEKISLENFDSTQEELTIQGQYKQKFISSNENNPNLQLVTIYIADKNGYHVRYKLLSDNGEEYVSVPELSVSSLKSLGG
ncbi:uncharacterized protein LOC106095695 [Stomoxys calcitrans]|uniref:uncharacterized protein LOC106095695 n=1 Tax=Stomoxys calcitrans TaxID=35570 RepID=UPI0027E2733F|nr:uncharacterized protein LOC106095695 [Stomoxys calcitrans]